MPSNTLAGLIGYWLNFFDRRKSERKLNEYPAFGARLESSREGISAQFNPVSDTARIYGAIYLGSRGNDRASYTERSFVNYCRSPGRSRADEIISVHRLRSLCCVVERHLLVLYGQTARRPVTITILPYLSRT